MSETPTQTQLPIKLEDVILQFNLSEDMTIYITHDLHATTKKPFTYEDGRYRELPVLAALYVKTVGSEKVSPERAIELDEKVKEGYRLLKEYAGKHEIYARLEYAEIEIYRGDFQEPLGTVGVLIAIVTTDAIFMDDMREAWRYAEAVRNRIAANHPHLAKHVYWDKITKFKASIYFKFPIVPPEAEETFAKAIGGGVQAKIAALEYEIAELRKTLKKKELELELLKALLKKSA